MPPLRLPGQRSQPGAHLPRYRRASRAARTQHLFTYCRASETSCRCPARTIRTKSRSVLVDKLLDPLPPVYNIGHSCNRGQKRSPEKNENQVSLLPEACVRAGPLRRARRGRDPAGPCGAALGRHRAGSALRRAAQNPGIPAPPIIYAPAPPPIGRAAQAPPRASH